jgi:hypothetical protein
VSAYIDGLPHAQEIEMRAACGHVVVLWNPNSAELTAIAEGPCASCAMDCGMDQLEELVEQRKKIIDKYDGRRRRLPRKE